MYLLIRYPIGIIVEALVLAQKRNRMRVAAAGFPDIIELRRSGAQWFAASGQPVEFDFLMSCSQQGESGPCSMPARAARAAG
ncbi:MAG: hypothetical protein ABSH45_18170 [Bryobacteraceae bacterium]|jgi:hypothetical protein